MGSYTSKLPVTEKHLKELECAVFRVGLGEMQGWRGNMEDASLIHIAKNHTVQVQSNEDDLLDTTSSSDDSSEVSSTLILKEIKQINQTTKREIKKEIKKKCPENNISIIGVFDGHGGSFVSRFVAENFMTVFNHAWVKSYKKQLNCKGINSKQLISNSITEIVDFEQLNTITLEKLEQILIQTFLDFDELLLTRECEILVHDYRTFKRDDLILKGIPKILSDDYNNSYRKETFAHYMGTTANVVCLYDNYIVVANVGDSMSVLFTEGKAVTLNTEHKTSTPGEEERVIRSGLTIHNNRVDGKLNLTRAIGDLQFKNKKLRPYEQAVTAYPEFTTYELTEDSEFLVSACDGIWDCVDPQKLCEFISKELKKGISTSKIIAMIEDMVISKTNNSPIGTDNMTCLILQFK